MTGYSFRLTLFISLLFLVIFPSFVFADEIPTYSSSPSASKTANATCRLSATRGSGSFAPANIDFSAESTVNGNRVDQFTYDFGDGTISTGSDSLSHRYSQAGSYLVTAQPVVDKNLLVNPCKMTITLKAFPFTATPSPSPASTPTITPVATTAAILRQPETGPSSIYWLSLVGLFAIWLGAELWYQQNRQMIG